MGPLIAREITLAVRSGGGVGLALAFFLAVVLISALGLGRDPDLLERAAPGVIWVAALLATLLSLDRLFQADHEDGSLDALMVSPQSGLGLATAKMVAHWATTGLPLVILSPVMALLMNLEWGASIWLILALAAGTPALSAIGMVGAALTLGVRRGGLLLSLLVLPLYIPTLIFGAETVRREAGNLGGETAFLALLAITLACLALAPPVTAQILRVNMR